MTNSNIQTVELTMKKQTQSVAMMNKALSDSVMNQDSQISDRLFGTEPHSTIPKKPISKKDSIFGDRKENDLIDRSLLLEDW